MTLPPIDDDDDDFESSLVTLITEGEVARELLNAAQAAQEEIDAVDYERRPRPLELEDQ